MAAGSRSGFLVDELVPLVAQSGESLGKIGDTEGDMVKSRSTPFQETSHRGLGTQGLQKLDGSDEPDPHTLGRDFLDGGTGFSGQGFEKTRGLLQGGYGHGNVVQWIRKHVIFGAWVSTIETPGGA
jgi:hypothetical protein